MSRGPETEVKLAVRDLRAIRRRLRELDFQTLQARHFETNDLLDSEDLRLWKARCLLRLRRTRGEWLLTFKGAPAASRRYKIRPEVETRVEDGARLTEIFAVLGLRPMFRYEKYRTTYVERARAGRADAPLLVLDETPIGTYLELEGPRRWIDRVAVRLGYHRDDYITASYGALYREYCRREGVPPTNMVFSHPKTC